MTIKDCIDEAVAGGEMDATRGEEAKNLFDEIEREHLDALGPEGAAARAAQETARQVGIEAAIRRRQALIAMRAQARISGGLETAVREMGLADRAEPALGLIDSTGQRGLPFRGAEQERIATRYRAHALFNEALATFRRTLIGTTRNKATLQNVVRESFGEHTGDGAAEALAKSWYETAEFLRKQFNSAGGHIGKLERWGLPQSHDTVKIREAAPEEWIDFVMPRLDRARMIDGVTGEPFSDGRLRLVLRDVYETLRTDGLAKVRPDQAAAGRSMANRRADHRFLHFRNADDWLAYQQAFGQGDQLGASGVWNGMLAHIDVMAREVGAMRALGPNPQATIRWLQTSLDKEAAEIRGNAKAARKSRNRLKRSSAQLQVLYDHYSGAVNQPIDGNAARFFAGLRSFLTSAQLGSAAISAVGDLNYARIAAKTAGLPQARLLKNHLKLLNPLNIEDQKLALRLGLGADNWSQVASAQMRYVGEIAGPEIIQRLSDGVLRLTGLSPWTQAGRQNIGMEFFGLLADNLGKRFDELPAPLRDTFGNARIDAQSWDIIRATEIYEPARGGFLRPDDVAAREDIAPDLADELATRLLVITQDLTELAVPSASLRGRAAIGGSARPGSISGELLRSTLMYKNFAVTLYMTHIRRLAQTQGAFNKARYGANLVIGSTLMGALAIQLKEISKGRDPRQMFGDKTVPFWISALTQGGGLGIFGDFAFADVNRFGHGFEQTVAGPVINFMTDAARLTAGNIREVAQGKETNAGAELTRFFARYTPGGSAWYARLALERLMLDQIQLAIDPDARRRWRRQEQKLNRELGTRFFWPRGAREPRRGPELENAFGG